jgi:uncharacterized protein
MCQRPEIAKAGEAMSAAPANEIPVTIVVSRQIKRGFAEQFEEGLRRIIAIATTFPGHLGVEVMRPRDPLAEPYLLIFRFASPTHLQVWEQSEARAAWLEEMEALSVVAPQVERFEGLEYWFTPPAGWVAGPPPRVKMIALTVLGLYPLIVLLLPQLAAWFSGLPPLLAPLLNVTIMVTIMTYLVMPALTRLFAFWLFSH